MAVRAIHLLAQERPGLAQPLLLLPLLSPLQRCIPAAGQSPPVEEWELSRCVDDVLKVRQVKPSITPVFFSGFSWLSCTSRTH